MDDYRPRLTIDLGALRRNIRAVRALRPGAEIMPVVKADAYGLGAEKIVPALIDEGCQQFFVAYPSEASALRPVSGDAVFHVLGPGPGSGPFDERCRPVLFSAEALSAWQGGPCGLQVDIGMNRLGAHPDDLAGIPPREDVGLVVAHLSHSGNPGSSRNAEEIALFRDLKSRLRPIFPKALFSLSATGGLMLDGPIDEDAVRPGVALYGGSPGAQGPLETVVRFEARVLSVHDVKAGDTVGYDGRWRATRGTRVATLSAGYADGIPRSLGGRGSVFLGGRPCPILGAVSMDLITVDLSNAPQAAVGDWGELFGPNLKLDEVAGAAGTIGYELLTAVRGRTIRIYRGRASAR